MRIEKEHVIFAMSKQNKPVIKIKSGSVITLSTCDCFSDQIDDEKVIFSELDWNKINPATGPIYIEEANPGDILKIEIKKITLNRDYAIMATGKNLGVLGDELIDNFIFKIPIKNNKAILPAGIEIDLNPMIGVIGVAPLNEGISCGIPCEHGGNLDCKEIKEGTVLYLPVNVPGALFALGDLHAAMGDGEVSVSGLEISGEVDVILSVIKNRKIPTPLIVTKTMISTIASAKTLDEAAILATKKMVSFFKQYSLLAQAEIITILSAKGDVKICQIVDPQKICRFELSKNVLNQMDISLE